MQAVLTGDIVNSTLLSAVNERKLIKQLQAVLSPYQYEFYRGDSFQVYLKNAKNALRITMLCRAAAIKFSQAGEGRINDVRLSIGIGETRTSFKNLSTAKGEPFILSGRALDQISKSGARLAILTGENKWLENQSMQIIAEYADAVFKGLTPKQASVIFELLNGHTQLAAAKRLKKSKSTISQHVNSGRWTEIERLLQHFENISEHLS